jgi:radical SAM superfamily enzyme YgiQ (UPF0313 family)
MILESELQSFRTKNKKRVAFIYPPYGVIATEPGLKVVKENYGVFPSLSLLYVAGSAHGAGHDTIFLDINAAPMSNDEIIQKLKNFDPDYICYTLTTYQFKDNLEWISELKKSYNKPVIVGGVHLEIYPEETLSHEVFDVGFIGECELSFPDFLERDVMDMDAFTEVPGIIFRKDGKLITTEPVKWLENPDHAHFPARHLLDNSLYYSFITKYKNFTPFISSRGCPFHCIFCEQGGLKFRGRSPQNIMDELVYCYEKLGMREFDFFDSSFTIDKKRVIDLCKLMVDSKLDIHWSVRSRVDTLNEEVLEWLAKAGCERIYYGIESGNPDILKTLRKNTNLQRIKDTLKTTKKVGIDTFGYFMVGSPGDTVETIKQTIAFSKTLDLDYAQFSKVSPMPRTELYEMYMNEFKEDYWKEFVKHPVDQKSLSRPRCDLSEEEIQKWCKKAYLEFYYRPSYILKALLRLKSKDELKRSVKTAWQMLFS